MSFPTTHWSQEQIVNKQTWRETGKSSGLCNINIQCLPFPGKGHYINSEIQAATANWLKFCSYLHWWPEQQLSCGSSRTKDSASHQQERQMLVKMVVRVLLGGICFPMFPSREVDRIQANKERFLSSDNLDNLIPSHKHKAFLILLENQASVETNTLSSSSKTHAPLWFVTKPIWASTCPIYLRPCSSWLEPVPVMIG